MKYGNPSQASSKDLNNYLLEKPQYVVSYNCSQGIPNWVSWQLNKNWLGTTDRQDVFAVDPDLPENCYSVKPTDYLGSGYDRGHLAPSGDRTRNIQDNTATFLMTNIIPQTSANNREVWRLLEEYCRELANQGKELYLVAGGEGKEKGIAANKITVPKFTWKVILIVDKPGGDIGKNTKTIAVIIPNQEKLSDKWRDYLVSVDEVEKLTGYDFFAVFPQSTQKAIESKVEPKNIKNY
jgi:endonuclease G